MWCWFNFIWLWLKYFQKIVTKEHVYKMLLHDCSKNQPCLSLSEADVSGPQWPYDPGVLSSRFSQQQSSQGFLSIPLSVSSVPLGHAENLTSLFSQRRLGLHQQHERGRWGREVRAWTRSEDSCTQNTSHTHTFLHYLHTPAVTSFTSLIPGKQKQNKMRKYVVCNTRSSVSSFWF